MPSEEHPCPLCGAKSPFFARTHLAAYHRCQDCRSVFMDPSFWLSPEQEAKRYALHRNDPDDPRYREFVSPLVEAVAGVMPPGSHGLDYGSGTGSAVAAMLRERGYPITEYDPFLRSEGAGALGRRYDFLACCEVAEHFKDPVAEFSRMRSLVEDGGWLFCMTQAYEDSIDFAGWRYKEDETHVFFYYPDAFDLLGKKAGFSFSERSGRVVLFRA